MKKVKIGIVGLSETAIQKHLPVLLRMIDVEVIGAFDPDISKFDKANAVLGTNLTFFNTYQEICFAADALVVCSPENVHLSQVEIAIDEYSLPVIVEEALDQEKADEKYRSIYESDNFTTLALFNPDISRAELGGLYDSFVERVISGQ